MLQACSADLVRDTISDPNHMLLHLKEGLLTLVQAALHGLGFATACADKLNVRCQWVFIDCFHRL
eukprot:3550832-Amphidinium_carterae.1